MKRAIYLLIFLLSLSLCNATQYQYWKSTDITKSLNTTFVQVNLEPNSMLGITITNVSGYLPNTSIFFFFDNFENDTVGTTPHDWSYNDGADAQRYVQTSTVISDNKTVRIGRTGSNNIWLFPNKQQSASTNYECDFKFRINSWAGDPNSVVLGSQIYGVKGLFATFYGNIVAPYGSGTETGDTLSGNLATDTTYYVRFFQNIVGNTSKLVFYNSATGAYVGNWTGNYGTANMATGPNQVVFGVYGVGNTFYDDVIIRGYSDYDPVITVTKLSESSYTVLINNSGANALKNYSIAIPNIFLSGNLNIISQELNPIISSINCTSCNIPNGDVDPPYTTADTTPTFSIHTNSSANCRISNQLVSYNSMNSTRQCTSGESTSEHICTLISSDELQFPTSNVYFACVNVNNQSFEANATALMQITNLEVNATSLIQQGIQNSIVWPTATVYDNQKIYLRNLNNQQVLATVDKVVVFGSQRWIINYNENNVSLGLFNITPVVYSLDMVNTPLDTITATVQNFINSTKR